ncbi:MAG: VUT family protein [Proteobacteria bacterium]|nr:VUT family protein [Pseudomonadota bacterium]
MLNQIRGKINLDKFKEYCLVLGYFISLFITTCFFFDTHQFKMVGTIQQLPIGLTFFPITFGISNIVQYKYGRVAANSLVFAGFIFDTLLVFGGVFLAWVGDRADYWTVFKDLPHIMMATWFFMGIGSVFNILLYNYLSKKEPKNIVIMLLRFFIAITATEILTSAMSMPLMFYKHGLSGSILLAIAIIVTYKVLANIIITSTYGIFVKK